MRISDPGTGTGGICVSWSPVRMNSCSNPLLRSARSSRIERLSYGHCAAVGAELRARGEYGVQHSRRTRHKPPGWHRGCGSRARRPHRDCCNRRLGTAGVEADIALGENIISRRFVTPSVAPGPSVNNRVGPSSSKDHVGPLVVDQGQLPVDAHVLVGMCSRAREDGIVAVGLVLVEEEERGTAVKERDEGSDRAIPRSRTSPPNSPVPPGSAVVVVENVRIRRARSRDRRVRIVHAREIGGHGAAARAGVHHDAVLDLAR